MAAPPLFNPGTKGAGEKGREMPGAQGRQLAIASKQAINGLQGDFSGQMTLYRQRANNGQQGPFERDLEGIARALATRSQLHP